MQSRRAALDAAVPALAARHLRLCLGQLDLYRQAETVLAYAEVGNEVPTGEVIAAAHAAGKRVYLPLVAEGWFAEHRPGATLRRGALGVPEPSGEPLPSSPEGRGIVLVPLLAFSLRGDRLGRGAGWYDRVLPRLGLPAVGVGYDFQERADLPAGSWDVRVDYVATESRLIECGRENSVERPLLEGRQ